MQLIKHLNIVEKDVVSIIGCHGKTTLLKYLSSSFKDKKVLMSTTTKIYKEKDIIFIDGDSNALDYEPINKIQCLGKYDSEIKKVTSLDLEVLNKIIKKYDYVFLEADGSNEKPIKTWKENEPVIINLTTKTVGVVDINCLGLEINDINVHNYLLYKARYVENKKDIFEITDLINMINEMFEKAIGTKILLINYVDKNNYKNALKVKEMLKGIDVVLIGDLIEDRWE